MAIFAKSRLNKIVGAFFAASLMLYGGNLAVMNNGSAWTMAIAEAASATASVDVDEEIRKMYELSPEWVSNLPAAKTHTQMVVVAGIGDQTAWISLHEKDRTGKWHQIVTTPGFIGKNGLGKVKEGDSKTPVGTYHFNKAFGILMNPGCKLPYTQVDENLYWSGDGRPGMKYNEMVNIRDYPELDTGESEHLIDYTLQYQYCLNISYNESGTPGKGSAIFMHCFGPQKPYTGGCVALPEDKMRQVMQRVEPECAVVIDSLENLGGEF
ncbi:L,D-transpeptidase family protein [Anaerovibrio sp.]|uniref:L,D-transpeptidase family protein n=1 Tax=Anaerovibrio sp. TaxID=1872532 RepID=UPI0025F5BF1E|nr:L,D-transpeptidase family protein [Anaerovibrio sp.]